MDLIKETSLLANSILSQIDESAIDSNLYQMRYVLSNENLSDNLKERLTDLVQDLEDCKYKVAQLKSEGGYKPEAEKQIIYRLHMISRNSAGIPGLKLKRYKKISKAQVGLAGLGLGWLFKRR